MKTTTANKNKYLLLMIFYFFNLFLGQLHAQKTDTFDDYAAFSNFVIDNNNQKLTTARYRQLMDFAEIFTGGGSDGNLDSVSIGTFSDASDVALTVNDPRCEIIVTTLYLTKIRSNRFGTCWRIKFKWNYRNTLPDCDNTAKVNLNIVRKDLTGEHYMDTREFPNRATKDTWYLMFIPFEVNDEFSPAQYSFSITVHNFDDSATATEPPSGWTMPADMVVSPDRAFFR